MSSQFRRRILLNPKDGYTLIHWHSGEDALVDGKWMDRIRDIPDETPLDWINYGCAWDSENRCYSNTGSKYMSIAHNPGVVFGSDFYIEVEASSPDLATYNGAPIDFGSITAPPDGTCSLGLFFWNSPKSIINNFKYNGNNPVHLSQVGFDRRSFDKTKFTFGLKPVSMTNGVSFVGYDVNQAISEEFPKISMGETRPLNNAFYLFRGVIFPEQYTFRGSIYDIKIYKRMRKSSLPPGYKELEYIQSTGTQYIDTGVALNESNTIILNGCINSSGGNYALFGVYGSVIQKGIIVGITGALSRLIFNNYFNDRFDVETVFRNNNTIVVSNRVLQYNNTIKEINNTDKFNTVDTALLFTSRNTAYGICSGQVYGLTILENHNLVLKYTPCINPQGEVGMYDTVTKMFFGNKGTGVFIPGYK